MKMLCIKNIKIYRYNIYIQYIYVYINNNISTYKLTPENKEIMIPFSNSGRGSYKILTVYTWLYSVRIIF